MLKVVKTSPEATENIMAKTKQSSETVEETTQVADSLIENETPESDVSNQRRLDFGGDEDFTEQDDGSGATDESGVGEPSGESQKPTLLDRIRGFGIEAEDEQSALRNLADRWEQTTPYMEQLQERLEAAESRFNRALEIMSQQRSSQSPETPTPTQQPESPWRRVKPLDIDKEALKLYQTADGGFKEDTPPEVLREVFRYQRDMERWLNDAMTDPEAMFAAGIDARIEKALAQRLETHDRQRDSRSAIQQMSDEVEQFIYGTDPLTGQVDRNTWSEFGRAFAAASQEAEESLRRVGIEPTREQVFVTAYQAMKHEMQRLREASTAASVLPGQQQPANGNGQQQTTGDVRQQQRQNHMRQQRAAGTQQAGGSTTGQGGQRKPAGKQNRMLTIGDTFAEEFLGS